MRDEEILREAYCILMRLKSDTAASAAGRRNVKRYCDMKFQACRYAQLNMSFFNCMRYRGP
jgi:hypothetical protein